MADGSIRIETRIKNDKLMQDLNQTKKIIDDKVKSIEKGISNSDKTIANLNKELDNTKKKLAETSHLKDNVFEKYKGMGFSDYDVDRSLNTDKEFIKLTGTEDALISKMEDYKSKIQSAQEQQQLQNKALQDAKIRQNEINNEITSTKQKIKQNAEAQETANKSISQGIKSILKYSMALVGIRSIFELLKGAMSSWLNTNEESAKQLKSDLEYMKYALGSALSPLLSWIVQTLYKILGIVGAIIKTFTGINVFSKATAENFDKISNSASDTTKQLEKQLAGFDQINKLNSNSQKGTSGSDMEMPETDLPQIVDDYYNKIVEYKSLLEDIGIILGSFALTKLLKDLGVLGGNSTWKSLLGFAMTGIGIKIYLEGLEGFADGSLDLEDILKTFVGSSAIAGGTAIITGGGLAVFWPVTITLTLIGISYGIDKKYGIDEKQWKPVYEALGFEYKGNELTWENWSTRLKIVFKLVELVWEGIRTKAGELIDGIKQGIIDAWGDFKFWLGTTIIDGIMKLFTDGFGIHSPSTVMRDTVGVNIIEGIKEGMKQTPLGNTILTICSYIKSLFTGNIGSKNTKSIGEGTVQGIGNGISNTTSLKKSVQSTSTDIKSWFTSSLTSKNFTSIGSNIVSGIKTGISNMMGSLKSSITTLGSNVTSWLKSKLGIHSPSTVMREQVGKWIPLGITEGIEEESESVYAAVSGLTAGMIPKIGRNSINYQPKRAVINTSNSLQNVLSENNTAWMDALAERIADRIDIDNTDKTYSFIAQLDKEVIFKKMVEVNNEYNFATNGGVL